MRRFLLQCSGFWILFCLLFYMAVSLVTRSSEESFKVADDVRVLFLGNSHMECGVNDSIIPHSFNFARSGERMEWIYAKLRLIKEANPQIDTVVLGFDNVLCFKNARTDDTHMGHYSPFFLTVTSPQDMVTTAFKASSKYNFDMYTKALNVNKLYEIYREGGKGASHLSMGGFVPSNRDKLKEDIAFRAGKPVTGLAFDDLSQYYLDKTVDYCQQNKITLLFVCLPQHSLTNLDRNIHLATHDQFYPQIPMLDYSRMPMPDSAFQDLDHLNARGARIFSQRLCDDLHRL